MVLIMLRFEVSVSGGVQKSAKIRNELLGPINV